MTKVFNRGLVIGKFYPFHNGHKYLIETALEHSKTLTVIICQTDRYKIPAEIRAGWLKKTFPKIDIKILNHGPEMDSNSTDISKSWADLTVRFLGYAPDAVFSSEPYGIPYAKFMDSKHYMVDLERKKIPISATEIRSDLNKHWQFLPGSTKEYFVKKIVVLGAESTGTTTLAQDLAKYYQTVWTPEYGRMYYEGKMFSDNSSSWNTAEFIHIANSQNSLEDTLVTKANKLIICDTDAFATTLWHERYMGKISKKLDNCVKKTKPQLYILTDIDIPFVQDGTRDGEHIRSWMHQRFVDKLKENNLNYIIVSGNKQDRLAKSVLAIEKALIF